MKLKNFILLLAIALNLPAAALANESPVIAELLDGTQLEIVGDQVLVVKRDGTKVPAPDGTHTLKDGTTITTRDGIRVDD